MKEKFLTLGCARSKSFLGSFNLGVSFHGCLLAVSLRRRSAIAVY